MDQIVVKLEDQNNGEILLYYVDENGDHQEGVLTTIENIENSSIPLEDNSYILSNLGDFIREVPIEAKVEEPTIEWSKDETKRLLIFFNDNKPSFVTGATQKKHLWAVACKTMLVGKNQEACESQLKLLKNKYIELRECIEKGLEVKWDYFDMCHVAFHDDPAVKKAVDLVQQKLEQRVTILNQEVIKSKPEIDKPNHDIIKHVQAKSRIPDEKMVQILNLYLKYKENFRKEYWRKDLWDTIALEMGEKDSEYIQKRFFNHKQHYIKLITQKQQTGSCPNWAYMNLFDKIFEDDINFQKKYMKLELNVEEEKTEEWELSENMILVKYVYDSFHEFEDPTIPNSFLWGEVGRLLDKSPECCKTKYDELRQEHLDQFQSGQYDLQKRSPLSIMFDYLIMKQVKKALSSKHVTINSLTATETDDMVQYFFNNSDLFKDSVCNYVCFQVVAEKLGKDVVSLKQEWDELLRLYKVILDEKKEDPEVIVDWRYIDLFDRMFDYGMDKMIQSIDEVKNVSNAVKAKPNVKEQPMEDTTEPRIDPKSTKILEFYLRNKDKFQMYHNKLTLWDPLCKEINMNSTQCSHRLRFLKQRYMEEVQKEIDSPKRRITWPHYALCKKVFGYRTVKNKLKQKGKQYYEQDQDDWIAREIKQLINYFLKNFHTINDNIDDLAKWEPLAAELGKSVKDCKDKFVELRKCYRKLKTMRKRNPGVRISWCYYNMFDRIYSMMKDGEDDMEVEVLDEQWEMDNNDGEDDFQCIIVLPEGQEITDISNAQIVIEKPESSNNIMSTQDMQRTIQKWTKRNKKRLLILYINYIRRNKNKEINTKVMWKDIASKLPNKTPQNCRKMFTKMLNSFKTADEITKQNSPFTNLLEKVIKLKPKFVKISQKTKDKTYKDVEMSQQKVNMALKYYLEHLEEFLDPKFEKKYLWTQLANHISEPVNKIFNKINYLKQAFNFDTEEINGHTTEFGHLLKEIISKEVAVNAFFEANTQPVYNELETFWTDDETEVLLNWYLGNLDKFKNPKFNRSYLWKDVSAILNKNPVVCSKKMAEIRTQYRNMVKQNSGELKDWKFMELCQKIYGTGKKESFESQVDQMIITQA